MASTILISHVILVVFSIQYFNVIFGPPIIKLTSDSLQLAWNDPRVVEHEWKKIKAILSTSIYAELLSKIDRLLGNLRRLTEQAERLEHVKGKRRHESQRPLLSGHRNVRKFAKSLHNAVVRGKCWKCACRHLHTVGFRLGPYPGMAGQPPLDVDFQIAPKPKFRMTLFNRSTPESTELQLPWHWQEVDAEPVEFEEPATSEPVPALEEAAAVSVSTTAKRVKKVQFTSATATSASLLPPLQINSLQIASPISDICSTLCITTVEVRPNTPIGFILDETHGKRRHNMFLVRKLAKALHTQSLEEVISSSWKCHPHVLQPVTGTFVFRPKERLYVAAILAASVLQLQGSWLKARWSSSDIIFPQPSEETLDSPSFAHPYISWNIDSCTNDNDASLSNPSKRAPTRHPLIKSKALLPLGLALTELSLGQTLSSLQVPEDEHPIKAVANLTTALGLLDDVYATSGDVYGNVVDYCLSYSGGSGGGRGEDEAALDDESVQQAVFDNVVAPLMRNLKNFEGR